MTLNEQNQGKHQTFVTIFSVSLVLQQLVEWQHQSELKAELVKLSAAVGDLYPVVEHLEPIAETLLQGKYPVLHH